MFKTGKMVPLEIVKFLGLPFCFLQMNGRAWKYVYEDKGPRLHVLTFRGVPRWVPAREYLAIQLLQNAMQSGVYLVEDFEDVYPIDARTKCAQASADAPVNSQAQ